MGGEMNTPGGLYERGVFILPGRQLTWRWSHYTVAVYCIFVLSEAC